MPAPASIEPADYWGSYELDPVEELAGCIDRLEQASEGVSADWVWRGVPNAGYGLQSFLARTARGEGTWGTEAELQEAEREILKDAINWGLHRHRTGPLTILELLAALQHTGTPTRLIDVTHSALVGLWFAVEKHDDVDGRVFAIDVSQRHVDQASTLLQSASATPDPPWTSNEDIVEWWSHDYVVWTPPPFEDRMGRQHGAFLVGGVPGPGSRHWYLRGDAANRFTMNQVRSVTSLALRCHGEGAGQGRPPLRPVRTFRVIGQAKPVIRRQLDDLFDLSYRTLFPDLAGFATYRKP